MHTDIAVAAIVAAPPGPWEMLLIVTVAGLAAIYSLVGIMLTNDINDAIRVLYDKDMPGF